MQGEKMVDALARDVDIDIKLASSHLRVLKEARLVTNRRQGRFIAYRLSGDDVGALIGAQADEIVAYCRGPFCLFAAEAVALLNSRGFRARKISDGIAEWSAAGMPLEGKPQS